MPKSKSAFRFAAVALAGVATTAGTQSVGDKGPEKTAPAVTYRSTFAGYRPFREGAVARWRDVNDEVARVGGHAGVLKAGDAAQPPAPPASATGTTLPPRQ